MGSKKIIVTGGAGFIGSNMVELLLRNGHSVEVADNLSSAGDDRFLKPLYKLGDLKLTKIDITKREEALKLKADSIMLLVHSITDIDQDIRRLCQSKIYLKQPTDVAKKAVEDLVFFNVEEERIIAKLKHLESGFGALNYMIERDGLKLSPDTLFIKTIGYNEIEPEIHLQKIQGVPDSPENGSKSKRSPKSIKANVSITIQEQKKVPAYVRLCYLGTFMKEDRITSNKMNIEYTLIKSREYTLEFLSDHKKLIKSIEFRASRQIQLNL